MLTNSQLEICRGAEIYSCDKRALIDIKNITVDKNKSVTKKAESFFEQVKNPYLFKVEDVVVKVVCCGDKDFSHVLCNAICSS